MLGYPLTNWDIQTIGERYARVCAGLSSDKFIYSDNVPGCVPGYHPDVDSVLGSAPGYPLTDSDTQTTCRQCAGLSSNRFRYSDNVPGYVPDYHSSHRKRRGNLNLPNWLVSHLRIHANKCECEREYKKTWAPMGLLKHQDVLWLIVRGKFYSSVLASGVSQPIPASG